MTDAFTHWYGSVLVVRPLDSSGHVSIDDDHDLLRQAFAAGAYEEREVWKEALRSVQCILPDDAEDAELTASAIRAREEKTP